STRPITGATARTSGSTRRCGIASSGPSTRPTSTPSGAPAAPGPRTRAAARSGAEEPPPPARAEEIDRATEELRAARRHGPPVELPRQPEPVDDDGLLRTELPDALGAVAAPDAALLHAAHRDVGDGEVDEDVVHAHRARLDPARDPRPARRVPRPHARREPVARVVREPDRLLLVAHA